jgi:hypothetical protein
MTRKLIFVAQASRLRVSAPSRCSDQGTIEPGVANLVAQAFQPASSGDILVPSSCERSPTSNHTPTHRLSLDSHAKIQLMKREMGRRGKQGNSLLVSVASFHVVSNRKQSCPVVPKKLFFRSWLTHDPLPEDALPPTPPKISPLPDALIRHPKLFLVLGSQSHFAFDPHGRSRVRCDPFILCLAQFVSTKAGSGLSLLPL